MQSYGSIIHSSLPYLQLDIEFPSNEMLGEARNLADRFLPHREGEGVNAGWYALVLHGVGEGMSLGYESYGIPDAEQHLHYHWTEAADLCPVTANFFRNVFPAERYARIRFMLLKPGGSVPFHTDYKDSKLASMSFALNHPQGFHFYLREGSETKEVPFQPGRVFALNLSYQHSVVNEGEEDRYHIIAHILRGTSGYRDLILRSFNASNLVAG